MAVNASAVPRLKCTLSRCGWPFTSRVNSDSEGANCCVDAKAGNPLVLGLSYLAILTHMKELDKPETHQHNGSCKGKKWG